MLTNVSETSLFANAELSVPTRANQQKEIIECLRKFPEGTTRKMISRMLGIDHSTVCARVNEMVTANRLTDGPDTMVIKRLSRVRAKVVRLNKGLISEI